MADTLLYHPELDVEITVAEDSAWVHLENGWVYVDAPKPAQPGVKVDYGKTGDDEEEEK